MDSPPPTFERVNKTARLLGIESLNDWSFERLQVNVRQIVKDSLIRHDIGNKLTKFTRAAITCHVKDACNH
jgi:hypothetical protein